MSALYIGTAGWTVPRVAAAQFPIDGSQLARYASVFSAVEINSSFYRPHRPATYARWADSVPASFRFAVKLPKEISHQRRLVDAAEPLDRFLAEATCLGGRLGPLLLQLPPSQRFDPVIAARFFDLLRSRFTGDVVCEPRHASWFADAPDALLVAHRIARVAADPAKVPAGSEPGGWGGLNYLRLHGSPEIYRSSYDDAALEAMAARLRAATVPAWCIFDNTMLGAAALNAAALARRAC
ncbi:DUF72 domain-containing protein [Roseiterribacter gracilis]|uniref:DUF72 domain-containing protein n=1 Tax=Roseiterribacter gracilis TaxID=2812848 RepID=A0A8S8XA43_9PROT|nr:hypothetical protein TMPK1_31150 [Rhodospirillales bacterium TMPK1]